MVSEVKKPSEEITSASPASKNGLGNIMLRVSLATGEELLRIPVEADLTGRAFTARLYEAKDISLYNRYTLSCKDKVWFEASLRDLCPELLECEKALIDVAATVSWRFKKYSEHSSSKWMMDGHKWISTVVGYRLRVPPEQDKIEEAPGTKTCYECSGPLHPEVDEGFDQEGGVTETFSYCLQCSIKFQFSGGTFTSCYNAPTDVDRSENPPMIWPETPARTPPETPRLSPHATSCGDSYHEAYGDDDEF